jgi:hypothetical protein
VPSYRPACDACRKKEYEAKKVKTALRPESHKRRDRKKSVARRFGLTLEGYNSRWEEFRTKQKDLCDICKQKPPVVLDHCHKTGKLRSLLCRQCNLAAGFVGDDPEIAERLADYLRRWA